MEGKTYQWLADEITYLAESYHLSHLSQERGKSCFKCKNKNKKDYYLFKGIALTSFEDLVLCTRCFVEEMNIKRDCIVQCTECCKQFDPLLSEKCTCYYAADDFIITINDKPYRFSFEDWFDVFKKKTEKTIVNYVVTDNIVSLLIKNFTYFEMFYYNHSALQDMTHLKPANSYDSLKDNMEELTMFMKHRSGQRSISYKEMFRVYEEGGVSEITVDEGNYLDTCLGSISRPKLVLRFYDDEGVCSEYIDGVLDVVREIPSRVVYARDVYEMVTENYRSLLAYEVENDIVVFGDMEMNLSTIESEFPGFTLAEITEDAEIYELNC